MAIPVTRLDFAEPQCSVFTLRYRNVIFTGAARVPGAASAHREQGINIHVFNSQDNLLVHDESEPMIDGETSTVGALVVHSAALEVPVNDDLDTT